MPSPIFHFFEEICSELSVDRESILTEDDFQPSLVEDLKVLFRQPVARIAIANALQALESHFRSRVSRLPFVYDSQTGLYSSTDHEYIAYVAEAQQIRGIREMSERFEISTTHRLAIKVTGALHRTGWRRSKARERNAFVKYLMRLGFRKDVQVGRDKDGGFDILWLPPLGAVPIRPFVSVQCKNSFFDRKDANDSTERAKQSMRRHRVRTAESTYLCCVVFNDYIDERYVDKTRDSGFIPLGISDLGLSTMQIEESIL